MKNTLAKSMLHNLFTKFMYTIYSVGFEYKSIISRNSSFRSRSILFRSSIAAAMLCRASFCLAIIVNCSFSASTSAKPWQVEINVMILDNKV